MATERPDPGGGNIAASFWERHCGRPLTFVFTDIVGSTRLKSMLGEDEGVARIQEHHAMVRRVLAGYADAEEIRTSGDSFLIVFAEPADAVAFALSLQAALSETSRDRMAIRDRIGIHRGAAVVQEGRGFKELLGSDVDACARLMSLADGDQILLTQSTMTAAAATFADRWPMWSRKVRWVRHGRYCFKGIREAQEIGEVGEPGRSRLEAPGGVWRSRQGRRRLIGWMALLLAGLVMTWPWFKQKWLTAGPLKTRVVALMPDVSEHDTNRLRLLEGILLSATEALAGVPSATAERVRVVLYSDLIEERVTTPAEARWQFGATQVILATVGTEGGRWEVRLKDDRVPERRESAASPVVAEVGELGDLSRRVSIRVAALAALRFGVEAEGRIVSQRREPDDEATRLYLTGLGLLGERLSSSEGAKEAVELLTKAVARDPLLGEAFAALGEARWREFRRTSDRAHLDAGFQAVLTAIELSDGKLASAFVALGRLRHEVGEMREAIRAYQRALGLQPNHSTVPRALARVYAALDERTKAEQTLLDSVGVDPDNWRTHNSLGVFYSERPASWAAAAAAFRRASELAPGNYLVWANLGGILVFLALSSDGPDGAVLDAECRAALDRSIALRPTAGAWSNRGTVDFFATRFEAAGASFEEAVRLEPDDSASWGNLGDALRHVPGGGARAREAHTRAIQLTSKQLGVNPSRTDLEATLAGFLAQIGDLASCRAHAERVTDAATLDVGSQMYLALAWEALGERARAQAVVQAAVSGGNSPRLFLRHPDLSALGKTVTGNEASATRSGR